MKFHETSLWWELPRIVRTFGQRERLNSDGSRFSQLLFESQLNGSVYLLTRYFCSTTIDILPLVKLTLNISYEI